MAVPSAPTQDLFAKVNSILAQIRPAVQADGGDVELVDIVPDPNATTSQARVRFRGACVGCPSSSLTLHMGIERAVRAQLPEISRVVSIA